MNILFMTRNGENISVAYKMANEGHRVFLFNKKNLRDLVLCNNLISINSWRPKIKDIDFVVCDGDGFGIRSEDISNFGKPIFGSSVAVDMFNLKFKEKGIDLLKKRGICFDEIENGLALKAHIFFNGRFFIKPIFYSFEENGNVIVASSKPNRIKEDILKRIEPLLVKIRYRGLVNIEFEINDLDYSIKNINLGMSQIMDSFKETLGESLTDVLFEVATGTKTRIKIRRSYMICVPIKNGTSTYPLLINGINEKNEKHVALNSFFKADEDYFYDSNNSRVLSVTARGDSIREAQRRVYRTIGNIKVSGSSYREDVGDLAKHKWQKLQEIAFL